MAPGQQASADCMVVEGAEDEGEADLAATTSMEAAGVTDTAATTRATDAVMADSTVSATIDTRADICGAIASSSQMDGPLLKAKRVEEQEEGEEKAVEAMAVAEAHLRHNKLGAKAIWAVHLGMAQNSKGWLLWDPFIMKFLVNRHCNLMENLMYKDWKAENEAKIGVRFGEVKSSGLEHVGLPLELNSSSTITRQSSLVNGGEEARNGEEEGEEVQQTSKHAPTLPSQATGAPRIRVTPQQRHESLHVPTAEEGGRGKNRIQAPNGLTYDALGKPAKLALAGAAMMVGDDEVSEYEEFAFAFFSPVEMPGEPSTLKEALESSDAEEWKKATESELKSIEENGTWELVELPEGRKAITSKWLFKIKSDADGIFERYKSRLVAKGYQQKKKVDYKELFDPVCMKGPEEESVGEEERRRFHSLVGSLMYAAVNT
ncbi:unnamed protein product [Closterium sp. NIES-53]